MNAQYMTNFQLRDTTQVNNRTYKSYQLRKLLDKQGNDYSAVSPYLSVKWNYQLQYSARRISDLVAQCSAM